MRFDDDTLRAAARAAKELGVPVNHLLAVAEVESAGKVSATVDGKQEPLVRFEGHWFYKRIVAHKRDEAERLGLAREKAGAVKNPVSQQERWDKLIKPAAALDRQAAYESTSWGLGQVMGFHWKDLGYGSVLALVDHARRGAGGQIELMARFIRANPKLKAALAKGDWATFAYGYNGPGYKANKYDTKMAAAAKRWAGVSIPAEPPAKPVEPQKPAPAPAQPEAPQREPAAIPEAKANDYANDPADGMPEEIDAIAGLDRRLKVIKAAVAAIIAGGIFALGWLAALPCNFFGLWCGG